MSEFHKAVVANHDGSDGVFRRGARVYVEFMPGDPDRIMVRGLSRGGRRLSKWTNARYLHNARIQVCRGQNECNLHRRELEEAVALINGTFDEWLAARKGVRSSAVERAERCAVASEGSNPSGPTGGNRQEETDRNPQGSE